MGSMAVSIQVDEHIPAAISKGLKQRGIKVHTVEEEEIKGYADEGKDSILEVASKNGRVILTNDSDFEEIHEREEHDGIIFIKSQYVDIGDVVREIVKVVDRFTEDEFRNSKFYVP